MVSLAGFADKRSKKTTVTSSAPAQVSQSHPRDDFDPRERYPRIYAPRSWQWTPESGVDPRIYGPDPYEPPVRQKTTEMKSQIQLQLPQDAKDAHVFIDVGSGENRTTSRGYFRVFTIMLSQPVTYSLRVEHSYNGQAVANNTHSFDLHPGETHRIKFEHDPKSNKFTIYQAPLDGAYHRIVESLPAPKNLGNKTPASPPKPQKYDGDSDAFPSPPTM